MKPKTIKPKSIYAVIMGYRDDNQIRHLTFDYESALDVAKKIVNRINKKNALKHKLKPEAFHVTTFKKQKDKQEPTGFGEIIVDRWKSNICYTEIVLGKMDKEYSPEWLDL